MNAKGYNKKISQTSEINERVQRTVLTLNLSYTDFTGALSADTDFLFSQLYKATWPGLVLFQIAVTGSHLTSSTKCKFFYHFLLPGEKKFHSFGLLTIAQHVHWAF